MASTTRTTWKRLAQVFAAGLHDKICADHLDLRDDCPYCRDTAALRVYRAKVTGQCDWPWKEIVTTLAGRFQYFEECSAHGPTEADPENCPFCRDEARWQQYVDFCVRQGVEPLRRDAEVMAEGAVSVSIYDLRPERFRSTETEHLTSMNEDARLRELSKQARLDYLGISEGELRIREPGWFETGPIVRPSEA